MEPYYRPTQPEDITELAPRLRECDVKEVKASNGHPLTSPPVLRYKRRMQLYHTREPYHRDVWMC